MKGKEARLRALVAGPDNVAHGNRLGDEAQTREAIPPMYIRRVERKNGELYNVEFQDAGSIKDPTHTHTK
jgi:branched-chain amino acid transport system substrate-binding protein